MNDKYINTKFITDPIYTSIEINELSNSILLFPEYNHPIKIELYCPICKEKRIFKCTSFKTVGNAFNGGYYEKSKVILGDFAGELIIYEFSCEYNHLLKLVLETRGKGSLIKIGQFPMPMLYSETINNDLIKFLDLEEQKYYMLSIKAFNDNLNIASFVYLRRVFESLIIKAKDKSKSDFTGKKTKDIVKVLVKESLLNEMLKENGYNVLYSLLSDGVHSLSEENCKENYELLKEAIEIILEDEIYKMKLEKRKKRIGNSLSNKNSERVK